MAIMMNNNIRFTEDGVALTGADLEIIREAFLPEISEITAKIEEIYGPIDNTYSLSINFNSNDSICTETNEAMKTVTICLPTYTMQNDIYQRRLNLSHELVHTVTPCDPARPTFFDEGLADYLSEEHVQRQNTSNDLKHITALNLVKNLLNIDREIINKLRKECPSKKISDYTMQDLKELMEGNSLSDADLQQLTKSFWV